jgi:hypothetical protein
MSAATTTTQTVSLGRASIWTGRALSLFAVLFLTFDTVIKVLNMAPAVESTVQLGYPASAVVGIGILELICLLVYVVPRTSVLGAILLTGYLGGAISTHVLAGSPVFSMIFPVIIGALLWGGLFLRNTTLRALIPLQR